MDYLPLAFHRSSKIFDWSKRWNSFVSAFRSSADFRFPCSIDSNPFPFKANLIHFGDREKLQGVKSGEYGICSSTGVTPAVNHTSQTVRYPDTRSVIFPQSWLFLHSVITMPLVSKKKFIVVTLKLVFIILAFFSFPVPLNFNILLKYPDLRWWGFQPIQGVKKI